MIILAEETVALKYIAIYYGLPRYGHARCFLGRDGPRDHARVEQVTHAEPDIQMKRCSGCGKLLLPRIEVV